MTNRTGLILGLVVGLWLSFLVAAPSAQAENRPAQGDLFTRLNGEVSRDLNTAGSGLADGGGATLWTIDAGIGCNTLLTGAVYEMHCNAAVHFCAWSDGGCSSTIGSQAYGRPVAASSASAPAPYFFSTQAGDQGTTKLVCMTPASTAAATCALFRMK